LKYNKSMKIAPNGQLYSTFLLKKFKLKEKEDIEKLKYLIESDIRYLVNTNIESDRFQKVLKNLAENIYGYIKFKSTTFIYEKSLQSLIQDHDARMIMIMEAIKDVIISLKNNI